MTMDCQPHVANRAALALSAFPPCPRPHIREAGPEDLPALQAFVRELSTTAQALRFFVPVAQLPTMLSEALLNRDPLHCFHVAEADDSANRGSSIVALGQFARESHAALGCHIAVVVADGWQRRGLGRRLLLHLFAEASRQGLDAVVGDVLRYNRGMIALARQLGFSVQRHPDDATLVRIVRSLNATPVTAAA